MYWRVNNEMDSIEQTRLLFWFTLSFYNHELVKNLSKWKKLRNQRENRYIKVEDNLLYNVDHI